MEIDGAPEFLMSAAFLNGARAGLQRRLRVRFAWSRWDTIGIGC